MNCKSPLVEGVWPARLGIWLVNEDKWSGICEHPSKENVGRLQAQSRAGVSCSCTDVDVTKLRTENERVPGYLSKCYHFLMRIL